MKKQLKAALAAVLALFMALAMIPASALPRFDAKAEGEPGWIVPAGYNEYDYNKCAAFLEQTDENGVKNGEKMGSSYDPNDPGTWGINTWNEARFEWTAVNGERRIHNMLINSANLCGGLDLSGCTALGKLYCSSNNLTELDLTGCTVLEYLYCSSNNLTELNVTGCSALTTLECNNNNLTELNLTGFTALTRLECNKNNLTELDLSNNPYLPYDHIRADGSGFVGCYLYSTAGTIYAYPMNGVVLEGFYDENGELVSEGEWDDWLKAYGYHFLCFFEMLTGTIIARFSILGDINGDGEVTPMDALLLMRLCIGVLDENQVDSRRADVNGDGAVDLMDANAVLRITIGLE